MSTATDIDTTTRQADQGRDSKSRLTSLRWTRVLAVTAKA